MKNPVRTGTMIAFAAAPGRIAERRLDPDVGGYGSTTIMAFMTPSR